MNVTSVLRDFQNPKPWWRPEQSTKELGSSVKELYTNPQSRWPPEIPSSLCHSMTQHSMDFIGIGIYPLTASNKRSKPQMTWICAAVPHTSVELFICTRDKYDLRNKKQRALNVHISLLCVLVSLNQKVRCKTPQSLDPHTKWSY